MKRLIVFVTLFFALNSFAQFSSKKMDSYVIVLNQMVTDSSYTNPDPRVFEELDEPVLEYNVNDNATLWTISKKKNFSDNEIYSLFLKMCKRGNESDFLKMTESENPAIRVYGFWALLKQKKMELAENVIKIEKEKEGKVFWNSFGCEVFPRETWDLMEELMERTKKYGN